MAAKGGLYGLTEANVITTIKPPEISLDAQVGSQIVRKCQKAGPKFLLDAGGAPTCRLIDMTDSQNVRKP